MLNWETPRQAVRCTQCGAMNTTLVLEFLSLERYSCGACGRIFETSSPRAATAGPVPTLPTLVAPQPAVRTTWDGTPAPRVGVEPVTLTVRCPDCRTEHVFRARVAPALERWLCGGCGLQFERPVSIPA